MNKKSFTVITAAYNSQDYIEKCIKSVINSKYDISLVEHIIVDDGSTDNTANIVKKYAMYYKHIHYYKKTNGNWGSVINYVTKNRLVHNDYVVICDSDDRIKPKAFYYVNKYSKSADIFAGMYIMHSKSRLSKLLVISPYYWIFRRNMFNKKNNKCIHSFSLFLNATYFKKELFYNHIKLKEKVNFQDALLIKDLFNKSNSVRWKPRILSYYWRWRKGNTMSKFNNQESFKDLLYIMRMFSEFNLNEGIFYYLFGNKKFREYLKANKIKFKLKQKFKIKMWPWYIKWFFYVIYFVFQYKNFWEKN